MAKNSAGRSGGTSRIKFVMFDAEIADDQIQSVTQAITNALRGNMNGPAVKRIAAVAANDASDAPPPDVETEYEEALEEDAPSRAASRPRGSRKAPKAPDVIPLDMHAGVSLADFAAGKDSNSQHKKYLIAAAWLKEHRSINAVGASHIYTCFRSMEWSVNIPDFWQPLRDLKAKKYFVKNEANTRSIILGSTT